MKNSNDLNNFLDFADIDWNNISPDSFLEITFEILPKERTEYDG